MENKNYYLLLFMPPKCSSEMLKEDLSILKAVFDRLSKEYTAFVGFEQGKTRILAVHVVLKNIDIDRFVIRKDFFVVEYEYIRFWYEKKSALKTLESSDLPKVKEYVKKICIQTEEWGYNANLSSGS